jgi:hypothetical protein
MWLRIKSSGGLQLGLFSSGSAGQSVKLTTSAANRLHDAVYKHRSNFAVCLYFVSGDLIDSAGCRRPGIILLTKFISLPAEMLHRVQTHCSLYVARNYSVDEIHFIAGRNVTPCGDTLFLICGETHSLSRSLFK